MANGEGKNTAYLYAESDGDMQKCVVSQSCAGSNFDAQRDLMAADAEYGKLAVEVQVTDGKLTIGVMEPSSGNTWIVWDNFALTYKGAVPSDIENVAADGQGSVSSDAYDLLGRKVNQMTKGVYIRNGKTVIVR